LTPAYIRPSALPKLEAQPCFVGSKGPASDAAARGTLIDTAWRKAIAGDWRDLFALPQEDRDAAEWAVHAAQDICGTSTIITDECQTKFRHPYFQNEFTADALCPEKRIVIDLKTGQLRSYKAQLAAYCLALMTENWTTKATGIALFCDQREVIHYEFSYEDAKTYVTSIIDAAVNRAADDYTPGDYCGWCAFADTCPARTEPTDQALTLVTSTPEKSLASMREQLLADPVKLGEFWRQYKLFEKEIAKPISEAMRAKLDNDETVPGWRIRYDAGREYFDSEAIAEIAKACTSEELITLLGAKVSGKSFREFCAVKGIEINEAWARSGAPIAKLMPEKKPTTKKG
jgi:CRISPR/Cas system-associated exonuclease Cas4 (RecB family)